MRKRVMMTHPVTKKWMARARYVMEQHLGRPLLSTEVVHHKDEDKSNDDIDNLELMSIPEHMRLHRAETSQEVKLKMGAIHKGKIVSEETRLKMSQSAKGKIITEEMRSNMSASRKGKPWSEARRVADNKMRGISP